MVLSLPFRRLSTGQNSKFFSILTLMVAVMLFTSMSSVTAGKRFNPEKDIIKYRAKLERVTLTTSPHTWTKANFRLGRALAHMGAKNNDVAQLDEAISALTNTLQIWKRDEKGKKWADVQGLLASAYRAKSLLVRDDKDILQKSITHISNAHEMFVALNNQKEMQRTSGLFAEILSGSGIRSLHGDRDVEAGLRHSETALERLDKRQNPVLWAKGALVHAEILRRYAAIKSNKELMKEAVAHARSALEVFSQGRFNYHRASAHYIMARGLRALNWLDDDIRLAKKALFSFHQARNYFTPRKDLERLAFIDGGEGLTLLYLAERYPDEYSAKAALEMIIRAEKELRAQNLVRAADFYQGLIPHARRMMRKLGHW